MYKYQITKYNPEYRDRDRDGYYTRNSEWTFFAQVGSVCEGRVLSLEEYEKVESAYLDVANSFLKESGVVGLYLYDVVNADNYHHYEEGDYVLLDDLRPLFQLVLREEMFARFEQPNCYVHFGMDYYMFIGVEDICPKSKKMASQLGLYVERSISPHEHRSKCRYIDFGIDIEGLIERWSDGISEADMGKDGQEP